MNQGPLPPDPPHNGTPTSIAAANAIRHARVPAAKRIHAYIEANPGATRREIEEKLGIYMGTVTGRTSELIAAGLVEELDERGTTCSGHAAKRLRVIAPFPEPARRGRQTKFLAPDPPPRPAKQLDLLNMAPPGVGI
jgi:hypothetical protein